MPDGAFAQNVPLRNVTVMGDTVHFVLNLNYMPQLWGIRGTVRATIEKETVALPWILDVARGVSYAAGMFSASLTRGDASTLGVHTPPPADTARPLWLSSDLLSAGLLPADADMAAEAELCADLTRLLADVTGEEDSVVPSLLAGEGGADERLCAVTAALLPALPPVPEVPIPPEADAVVAACVANVFTVLLHHNHLAPVAAAWVEQVASAAGGDASIPVDVLRCWKAANRCVCPSVCAQSGDGGACG